MGVDITAYRCRIGRFGGICGIALLTVNVYVDFDNGLRAVGSVLFIGILLLTAGIESNPGPISGQLGISGSKIGTTAASSSNFDYDAVKKCVESSVIQEDKLDRGYEETSRMISRTSNQGIKTHYPTSALIPGSSTHIRYGTSDSYSQRVSPSTTARYREVREMTQGQRPYSASMNRYSSQIELWEAHRILVGSIQRVFSQHKFSIDVLPFVEKEMISRTSYQGIRTHYTTSVVKPGLSTHIRYGTSDSFSQRVSPSTTARYRDGMISRTSNQGIKTHYPTSIVKPGSSTYIRCGTSDSFSQRVSPSTTARCRNVREMTQGQRPYSASMNRYSSQIETWEKHRILEERLQLVLQKLFSIDRLPFVEKGMISRTSNQGKKTRYPTSAVKPGSSTDIRYVREMTKGQRPYSAASTNRYSSQIDGIRNLKRNACTQTPISNLHSDASDKRECIHYSVSAKCWPRVYKSQQVITGLLDRCSYIESLFEMPSLQQKETIYLSDIDIYIDSTVDLELKSLLVRCDEFERKRTQFLHVSQRSMPENSISLRESFAGIFIDKEGVKLIEAISPEQMNVVVRKESFVEQSHRFELKQAKLELSSILEQVVFETLTVKFNMLKQFYETRMDRPTDQLKTHYSIFNDMVIQYKDTVEQLLGEMVALFKRSTLPQNRRPVLLGFEKKEVSKKVKEQLFDLDKTIRGCGYSYSTFNVNVEKLSDEEETTNRKNRITHFLKENGITNIKFNNVAEPVDEYKHVGARISVPGVENPSKYHKGTLGGFASFSKENKTSSCALFSRHVALGCNAKLYVDGDNGQFTEFGEILEDTLQHGSYDIAAAKIHEERVSECDFQFKNSEDVPLPGKLYKSATELDLQHLPVHLWGSKSKPGLGIIKIPELNYPEATETYIQIEDRDPSGGQVLQRMAVEGDSGAIVCADDLDDENVHVISMLIGSNTDEKLRENPNEKASYITFPVKEGVDQLQRKTDGIFSLKGVNNDE